MRVLHVLNSDHFSGAENVVCQIIDLFRDCHDVKMAYASPDGTIREALADRSIDFFPMKKLCHSEVEKIVEEFKPDIIHGHDIRGALIASQFSRKAKIIHTIHGNSISMRRLGVKSLVYLWAARVASHIFWVSKTCLEQYYFSNAVKGKSSILSNVVNATAVREKCALDLEEYNYNVVFIGRLDVPKNPQKLIRVLEKSISENHRIRVAIVGTGPQENEIKKLVKYYGMENYISFLGFKKNPLKILGSARVMVMTSDWEGTPMISLESIALGIPIVSTPTDGMCEIVENGVNGYLSGDENTLSQKISAIIADDTMFQRLSEGAIKKSEEINNIQSYKSIIMSIYKLC